MDKEKLKKLILELLMEDEEFKYTLIGILATGLVTKDELKELLLEIRNLRADFNERIIALEKYFNERILALEQRMEEMRKDFNREITLLRRDLNNLSITVNALGTRWGLLSEEAFRNALRGLLEEWFGVKVDRWVYMDEQGEVYGYPSIVEVDVVIRDNKHILVEIKSHVRRSDISEFLRIAKLYEKVHGVKPELIMVSPFVDSNARKLAQAPKNKDIHSE